MLTESTKRAATAGWIVLLLALGGASHGQQEVQRFVVDQALQRESTRPAIRAYLTVRDTNNAALTALPAASLSGTLGERALRLESVRPLQQTGEGVAYIFLVDISKSLSETQFQGIRQALYDWTGELEDSDRAAVIAFGESARLVVDFTGDREAIRAGIASLGPTDNQTLLNQALVDALDLSRRRDPDLPGRRVAVVLTDGRDEGSGLAAEDVLDAIRRSPTPIYAIGYSQLRDPAARQRYLDLLLRFATNSGGSFLEASQAKVAESYAALRRAIREVWVADFACPSCRTDGNEYRLQIELSLGGRVLSDGTQVRLLPLRTPPAPAPTSPAPPAATPDTQPPATPPSPPSPAETARRGPGPWPWLVLLLVLAAAAGVWIRRRLASEDAEEGETEEIESISERLVDEIPESTTPPARLTRPTALRGVRLIVVRGNHPGKQYRLFVPDRAVVGARSTCDCVLIDEPGIAPEQFELYQEANQIYVSNLSQHSPTLLDGLPIENHQLIKNDDLLGTRDLILRVLFD